MDALDVGTDRRTVAVMVGEPAVGFALADTETGEVLFRGPLPRGPDIFEWGEAVGIGRSGGRPIAIVAGTGRFGSGAPSGWWLW